MNDKINLSILNSISIEIVRNAVKADAYFVGKELGEGSES